jgi:hypothetical protein
MMNSKQHKFWISVLLVNRGFVLATLTYGIKVVTGSYTIALTIAGIYSIGLLIYCAMRFKILSNKRMHSTQGFDLSQYRTQLIDIGNGNTLNGDLVYSIR